MRYESDNPIKRVGNDKKKNKLPQTIPLSYVYMQLKNNALWSAFPKKIKNVSQGLVKPNFTRQYSVIQKKKKMYNNLLPDRRLCRYQ